MSCCLPLEEESKFTERDREACGETGVASEPRAAALRGLVTTRCVLPAHTATRGMDSTRDRRPVVPRARPAPVAWPAQRPHAPPPAAPIPSLHRCPWNGLSCPGLGLSPDVTSWDRPSLTPLARAPSVKRGPVKAVPRGRMDGDTHVCSCSEMG